MLPSSPCGLSHLLHSSLQLSLLFPGTIPTDPHKWDTPILANWRNLERSHIKSTHLVQQHYEQQLGPHTAEPHWQVSYNLAEQTTTVASHCVLKQKEARPTRAKGGQLGTFHTSLVSSPNSQKQSGIIFILPTSKCQQ